MERIQFLIDKLVEQKHQNASAMHMLATVQLLQKELQELQQKSIASGATKVTVVLPNHAARPGNRIIPSHEPSKVMVSELQEPEPVHNFKEEYILKKPVMEQAIEASMPVAEHLPTESNVKPVINEPVHLPFDPIAETPTLLQHQNKKEIYDLITEQNQENKDQLSLNDKLKQEKTELGQVLKEAPIKDLRKAIGINDKFTFVTELFRGDEAMYERSIKTINGFHILPEAEYWINRELKVKLGWNDNKEVVQHFYQLVRRRFS